MGQVAHARGVSLHGAPLVLDGDVGTVGQFARDLDPLTQAMGLYPLVDYLEHAG